MEKKEAKTHEPRPNRSSGVAPKKRPQLNEFLQMAPLFDNLVEAMGGAFAIRFADERLHQSPKFHEYSESSRALQKIPLEFEECGAYLEFFLPQEREKLLEVTHIAILGQISLGVVHDLKNIIGAMGMCIRYARELASESDKPELQTAFQTLDECLNAGISICARSERMMSNRKQVQEENIRALVESAITLSRSSFRDKQITIKNHVDEKISADIVHSDVQLALMNIMLNAVEHGMQKQGTIIVTAHEFDGQIYLRIENDGMPIPEEVRNDLFAEPLSKSCNVGYGLYVSAMNLRRFGADIEVKSDPEKTVFILRLPAVPQPSGVGDHNV